jgi:hypothetical protein
MNLVSNSNNLHKQREYMKEFSNDLDDDELDLIEVSVSNKKKKEKKKKVTTESDIDDSIAALADLFVPENKGNGVLDINKNYLWILDSNFNFVFAPEVYLN